MTQTITPGTCVIWTTSTAVTGAFSDVATGVADGKITQAQLDMACQQASDLLYMLSGRQYPGSCERTFRPTARPLSWTVGEWMRYFASITGEAYNMSWGACIGGFHDACRRPPQIDLGVPIVNVVQVKIDGTIIPPNEYRVDENRLLVRVRPTASSTPTVRWGWPTCQNLDLPDTEPGTFSVDAVYGMSPPTSAVTAATALAAQMALAHSSLPNRLPQRLTTITRQGITMTAIDPLNFLDKGLTGVYEVDLFIKAANPQRQRRIPRVFSPDVGYTRTQGS